MSLLVQIENATIAITGATGFLGGYLVAGLRARGARVLAVVRDREKAARLLPAEVEIRLADLSDRAGLAQAFTGADVVISNAAVISFRTPKLAMRTNAEGTRNVFESLASVGVKRAIAISSSAAYPSSRHLLDERTPLRAPARLSLLNAYGLSKAEGERAAWSIAARAGIALTSFRPCGITGPLDPLLIAAIARVMRVPLAPFPAFTEIGVVHAGDVVDAVVRALVAPDVASGKAYNLQGNTVTLWQIADAWERAGGRAPRLRLPIPIPIALRYDDSLARRELGWHPRSLEAIVEEAVRARATTLRDR
jgi:nucleoside-diphosphate-sugar epimerase